MRAWIILVSLACLGIVAGLGVVRWRITRAEAEGGGRPVRMFVTGYTSCDASIRAVKACDGITASGRRAAPGTAACGPSYRFGTVFEIQGYGRVTCWDRGGAISDRNLDVWFPDVQSAVRAGIGARWMDVTVYSQAPADEAPRPAAPVAAANAPSGGAAGRGALVVAPPAPAPAAEPTAVAVAPPAPSASPTVVAAAKAAKPTPTKPPTTAKQNSPPAVPKPADGAPLADAQPASVETAEEPAPASALPVAPRTQDVAVGVLQAPATRATDGESGLGNLMTDMLRAQYQAQVALVANKDLRGELGAGPIQRGQLAAALAPGRKPMTLDLRGDQLRRLVELSLSRLDGWDGFLHVSGLRVGYNPDAPVGQRLTRFTLASGEAVADQAWYRVALTDGVYLTPGYTSILETGKGLFAYQPLEEMAAQWLARSGAVRPSLDGRLAVVR